MAHWRNYKEPQAAPAKTLMAEIRRAYTNMTCNPPPVEGSLCYDADTGCYWVIPKSYEPLGGA